MPKAKFYAVACGREGPKVYDTWAECDKNTTRFPGGKQKSFTTRELAERWIQNEIAKNPHLRSKSRSPCNGPPPGVEVIDISDSDEPSTKMASSRLNIPRATSARASSSRATPSRPSPSKKHSVVIDLCDSDSDIEVHLDLPPPLPPVPEPPVPVQQEIVLSPEQEQVLQRVKEGKNVFFTGSAGTGKSVLLREIIKTVRANSATAITASTGIAAVNIGGTTLHSWAGIGLGSETVDKYVGKFRGSRNSPAFKRWCNTKVLIIDEVSMLDGKLFDKLEEIGRKIRHSEKPFGGIQLVLSGDFCQLPPVPDRKDGKTIPVKFAFDANSWDNCVGPAINLSRVFRQKEQKFVDMLNAMRWGELDEETVTTFRALSREVKYDDGIEPTGIFSLRTEVENANSLRLKALKGDAHKYVAKDTPGLTSDGRSVTLEQMDRLLERLVCPREIVLKVGAQVMLVKNLEQGCLVNGSVGKVEDFMTSPEANNAAIEIALGPQEEDSQKLAKLDRSQKWPVVRFINGRRLLIIPEDFTVENSNATTEAKRDQVPLILAWALSVHKSQGQTLERVRVDLKSTFEKGQAYVALSRATTMDGLQVLNFNPTKVAAHPRVLEWSKSMRSHEMEVEDDAY